MTFLPGMAATVIAGLITNPDNMRPCAVEYTKGVRGAPLHLTLGADGRLYTGESLTGRILQLDPDTGRTREFSVPGMLQLHDIIAGPDGNIWFDALNDRFGKLDPRTGIATVLTPLSPGSQPHDLVWDDGKLYLAELLSGRLAVWDPRSGRLSESARGLPTGNQIHSLAVVAGGDIWATLSAGNAIARFDPSSQRFVEFVQMPIPASGPRDITYVPRRHSVYFTLFAANRFARYDLQARKLTVYPSPIKAISLTRALALTPAEKLTFVRSDARERFLYSGTFQAELVRFDMNTGAIKRVVCGITFPAATAGIANDARGRLWFNEAFPSRLARLQP
jgi:streptogramin lyase